MSHIKININMAFSETDDPVTEKDSLERLEDGSFKLVFEQENEFDIDRLENAALHACYPSLRIMLSEHLERVSKKKPSKNSN